MEEVVLYIIVRTNVLLLVWKPPGLEVLASKTGVPYTTFAPLGGNAHVTLTL